MMDSRSDSARGAELLFGEQSARLRQAAPLEEAFVVHGEAARLARISELAVLASIDELARGWDGAEQTVRAWSPSVPSFELSATRGQISTLYRAGFTILFSAAHSFIPELRTLCRELEADLDVPVGAVVAQLFCAPNGGRSRAHFDHEFNISCQLRGEKTWRLQKNPALRFPPRGVGMFLGRPVPTEALPYLTGSMPHDLGAADVHRVVPGGVVFVPPGILHETEGHSESLSVTFALTHTDCLATDVARTVEQRLLRSPELRAPRLGAQYAQIDGSAVEIARNLRELAAEIDRGGLRREGTERFRVRLGLEVTPLDAGTVVLRGERVERELALEPTMATILCWAASRRDFCFGEMTRALAHLGVASATESLARLRHVGLVEQVTGV